MTQLQMLQDILYRMLTLHLYFSLLKVVLSPPYIPIIQEEVYCFNLQLDT